MIPSILEPDTPCSSNCSRTPFFASIRAGRICSIIPRVTGESCSQSFRTPKSKSNLRPEGCSIKKLYEGTESSSKPLKGDSKKSFVGSDTQEVVLMTASRHVSGCGAKLAEKRKIIHRVGCVQGMTVTGEDALRTPTVADEGSRCKSGAGSAILSADCRVPTSKECNLHPNAAWESALLIQCTHTTIVAHLTAILMTFSPLIVSV